MPTTVKQQRAFLCAWAENLRIQSNKLLSTHDQFASLAVGGMGWKPGNAQWCALWGVCFGEEYAAESTTTFNNLAIEDLATMNLKEPRRRRIDSVDDDAVQGGVSISAINTYFDSCYGTDFTKLEIWQRLCVDVGVEPAASIKKCKKALRIVLVNIYDFLQPDRPIRQFDSFEEYRRYTRNGRVYPLHMAKEDGFLSVFLKPVGRGRRR